MNKSLAPIREINPGSEAEIRLVAERMRQTLVEVLGEERGISMYSMDWLVDRVKWHLDPAASTSKVFLTQNEAGHITGHAMARLERNEAQNAYGYFSTIFVEPAARRQGLAKKLLNKVETWFQERRMPKVVYNTAENHTALIQLFESHGYRITDARSEMVQMTKVLTP